jgi:hypothetical protein
MLKESWPQKALSTTGWCCKGVLTQDELTACIKTREQGGDQ